MAGGFKRKKKGARRLQIVLILLAAAGVFFIWSNAIVQTEQFSYRSARLPDGFDGCRIAVLSDLHSTSFGPDNQHLLDAVAAQKPDFIAVVGDLVDRFRGVDWTMVEKTAAGLAKIAPVYYVTGNHEWAVGQTSELKAALEEAGWHVLSNAYVPLERNGSTIVLAGIDDPNGYADQKTPETLATELHTALGDPFWILLAHRNDRFAAQYSLLGADLTLSGHGHGGMIRLPGTDGLIGTQRDWFPSYTAGFYEANGHTVFVSRGLGNSGPSFRLFNRPQVAVVTLEKESAAAAN